LNLSWWWACVPFIIVILSEELRWKVQLSMTVSPVNQNSFWPLQACHLDWWSTFQFCSRYLTYNFLNQILNVLARSKELVDLLRKVELAYATHIYGRTTHSSNVLLDLTPILQEQIQILILHLQPWRAFFFLLWWCVWLLFWRSTDHCEILRRAILLLSIAVFCSLLWFQIRAQNEKLPAVQGSWWILYEFFSQSVIHFVRHSGMVMLYLRGIGMYGTMHKWWIIGW
jgi:hypothetical protein